MGALVNDRCGDWQCHLSKMSALRGAPDGAKRPKLLERVLWSSSAVLLLAAAPRTHDERDSGRRPHAMQYLRLFGFTFFSPGRPRRARGVVLRPSRVGGLKIRNLDVYLAPRAILRVLTASHARRASACWQRHTRRSPPVRAADCATRARTRAHVHVGQAASH